MKGSLYKQLQILMTMLAVGFILLFSFACKAKGKENNVAATHQKSKTFPHQDSKLFTIRYSPKWNHQSQFAGFYMAREKGIYRKYGLNVEILALEPGNSVVELLRTGEADVTTMMLLTALNNHGKNIELVNLAQCFQHSNLMLVGKKSRGINSMESLEGKRIGLWLSDYRELSQHFLKTHVPNPIVLQIDWTNTLFLRDAIDVANLMYYNEYHILLMSGLEEEDLFTIRFKDLDYDYVEDGIYTTRAYFDKHPQECKAFADATMEGWRYAFNNPEETLAVVMRIMKEHHLPTNISHQRWMLSALKDSVLDDNKPLGVLDPKDFADAKTFILPQNPAISGLAYERFFPHGSD